VSNDTEDRARQSRGLEKPGPGREEHVKKENYRKVFVEDEVPQDVSERGGEKKNLRRKEEGHLSPNLLRRGSVPIKRGSHAGKKKKADRSAARGGEGG